MAVGAGSIKRAAKANLENGGSAEQVQKETVKKSSGKKAGNAAKKASVKDEKVVVETDITLVEKKMTTDEMLNKTETVVEERNTEMNQVCHITEDLPIYLL